MSGASVSITVQMQDEAVSRAFNALGRLMTNTRPLMHAIGVGLAGSTHQRFVSQSSPDGHSWTALNPAYAAEKRNIRILTESGRLRDSIHASASADEVRVGTNVIYAAAHQFGAVITPKSASHLVFRMGGRLIMADSITLPARPFLGISSSDETMIAETVFDFFERYSRN